MLLSAAACYQQPCQIQDSGPIRSFSYLRDVHDLDGCQLPRFDMPTLHREKGKEALISTTCKQKALIMKQPRHSGRGAMNKENLFFHTEWIGASDRF